MDAVAEVRGLPVVGSLVDFRRDRLGLQLRAATTAEITRFRLGWRTVWCTGSWDLAQQVLVTDEDSFVKGPALSMAARPLLGDGLLSSEKERHRRQRKLMAPAFTPRRMAGYAGVMAARAAAAVARLRPHTMIDIAHEMMVLTLDIVGRTLFDVDLTGDAREVGDALTAAMQQLVGRGLVPVALGLPLPRTRRLRAAVDTLDQTVLRVIATRRAARTASGTAGDDRGDVLSILLDARDDDGAAMTDRELRDEIMTLMLAGHETTANLLAWTWYLLATHPAARARLDAELDGALGRGDAGRDPTYDDLPRLPYAMAVLEESLRLYPPAYVVGRQAERPVTLGAAKIATGDIVLVSIRGMHRRADYWPEPEAFRPERFERDRADRKPRVGFLPFGAGPRVCIGNHFALAEAHLILATWARRFRFRLAQPADIPIEPLVTLRPRGGVHVEVEPR